MVTRINLVLEQEEYSALLKIAVAELRTPPDQAHYLLRCELEQRGLIPVKEKPEEAKELQGGSPS